MSYQAMADALAKLVQQKAPGAKHFNSRNVSAEGDWDILDSSGGLALVLEKGPSARPDQTLTGFRAVNWTIRATVCSRYTTPLRVHKEVTEAVQALMDTVDAWWKFNATTNLLNGYVQGDEGVIPLFDTVGGGPHYMACVVTIIAEESNTTAAQE